MSKKELTFAEPQKLFAVAFGTGGHDSDGDLEGDSSWGPTISFPYIQGMTPTEMFEKTVETYYKVDTFSSEGYEDADEWFAEEGGSMFAGEGSNSDSLAGWWIVPESILKVANFTAKAMPPAGGDRTAYAQCSTLKAIVKAGAVKTLKCRGVPKKYKKMIEEGEYES